MQKLILPINSTRLTAGYKNANYRKKFGFNHYGVDATNQDTKIKTVYASGKGKVIDAGWDNKLGWTIVIQYNDCKLTNGQVRNLIVRMWHFDRIFVSRDQSVTKDTKIGAYGNTGEYSSGAHLHYEIDTDCNYPLYSPTLGKSSNLIKKGTDTTINPCLAFYIKTSSPDNQSVKNAGYNTVSSSDLKYQQY